MRLLKVKVFNRIQEEKYREDVKNHDCKSGGFPFLPMYVFNKDNGERRVRGYVVTEGSRHRFYLTKMEVFNNEGLRVHI